MAGNQRARKDFLMNKEELLKKALKLYPGPDFPVYAIFPLDLWDEFESAFGIVDEEVKKVNRKVIIRIIRADRRIRTQRNIGDDLNWILKNYVKKLRILEKTILLIGVMPWQAKLESLEN
jgi:hypothetical protein